MEPTAFTSARMEREYLMSAAPPEVLRYIDAKAATHNWDLYGVECIPVDTQTALFERNDRVVDIALARVAPAEILLITLARHTQDGVPDAAVLEAALSNGKAGGGNWGIPLWLKAVLPWVAHHGDEAHLQALFQNPQVALDAISHAMRRTEAFQGLDEKRVALVLRHALDAPPVKRGPKDTNDGPDLSMYGVMQAVWGSLLTLPPESAYISVSLNRGLQGASKIMVGSPEVQRDFSEPWEQGELRYLRLVLDRWSASEQLEGKAEEFLQEQHRGIRESIATKASLFNDAIKSFVLNHPDVYVRRGYYAGLRSATLDELKGYEAKDGYHFLKAALRNRFFHRRRNQDIAVWFHERMSETPVLETDYESLRSEYERHLEAFRRGTHPEEYFEDDYQASHPEAYAELKEEERQVGGRGPTLEDIQRSLQSLTSALAAKTAGTGWVGWLIAAAVGYGIAKMR